MASILLTNALKDLEEKPAMVYVSEVCHFYKDRGDCYGGGMHIDPVFPAYDVKACVGKTEYTIIYLSEEKNKKYSQRGTYELLVEICM